MTSNELKDLYLTARRLSLLAGEIFERATQLYDTGEENPQMVFANSIERRVRRAYETARYLADLVGLETKEVHNALDG